MVGGGIFTHKVGSAHGFALLKVNTEGYFLC